ncbi:DUF2877 domain-containing protein [Klebsiella sp. BIGb0407]|uniref:DUF2877 domain-containing protein n=1 Tax=Klebsiella sp. BIGb0407 TaxID=2940603 RepID=UPI002167F418|nr:DUF2877 domain-containing protein [Klebsiella sp. BIGb0407]MCS3432662.1 hypothetical protein [Klebsiella sp. BIGb0407]
MNTTTSHRQILYGLTADTHFLNLLNQPQLSGKVEQVFNKAINVLIDNQLFTLLSSQLDNAPNSCRLLNKDLSALSIVRSDDFQISDGKISIGDKYWLSFSLCEVWQQPVISFTDDNTNKKNYQSFLLKQIDRLDFILTEAKGSLFNYQDDNLFYLAASEKLNQLRSHVVSLLEKKQYRNLADVIRQFIGLGIGLTPSGDDYLVGLIAFLLLKNHPVNVAYPDFYQGIMQGIENTTPVSAITLKKALDNEYRENMHQLIQSLVDADETNIHLQFLNILNIGSSSGSDMLFGIRDALYLTHYFGERYVD